MIRWCVWLLMMPAVIVLAAVLTAYRMLLLLWYLWVSRNRREE